MTKSLEELVQEEVAKQLPAAIREFLVENLRLSATANGYGGGGDIRLTLDDPDTEGYQYLGNVDAYEIKRIL